VLSKNPAPSRDHAAARAPSLVVLMVLAVAAVAALAYWDEQRESAAALDDFAEEQARLAAAVASELGARLSTMPPAATPVPIAELLHGAPRFEQPGAMRILVMGPEGALHDTDGHEVESEPVRGALGAGRTSVWLGRPEAAALGLRPRRAAAGLRTFDAGPLGRWGVAVVSSAERVRDREQRAHLRLALGVPLAGALVFLFGSVALRRQRRGLLLERELAIEALGRERDAELATASRAATMGTLAMGIAHEVGTPLGIIAGRAEQLAPRVEADERAARAVRAILEQTDRIRGVVRGFLDAARGEAPALADTPPAAVVDGAVALVGHRLTAAGVALSRRAAEGLPAIRVDVPMLQHAIVNLLLNACDACGPGGHVLVEIERDGEKLTFTVRDDGPGITEEAAARATEPFFTTKGHGSGLGLAIANEIVKLHRGSLRLRPTSPRGTAASITLPVPKASADVAA
jgi:signal transduction histidine kinase